MLILHLTFPSKFHLPTILSYILLAILSEMYHHTMNSSSDVCETSWCSSCHSWVETHMWKVLHGISCYTMVNTICLTHWGQVTHICGSKLTIIGSDNGLSPEQCQAIIWTNAGILLIRPLGTNFSEIWIEMRTFSLKKIHWKCRWRNVVHFFSASMC